MPAHSTGSVMLSEAVGCKNIWKSRITNCRVRIVGALFAISRGIGFLAVERILDHRLKGLVMSGQRTVFQSAGDIEPPNSIRMERKRLSSSQSSRAFPLGKIRGRIRRSLF